MDSLRHLVQACRDRDLSYQEAATYLRIYGAETDQEDQDSRVTNQVKKDLNKEPLSYEKAREIYKAFAEDQGATRAFNLCRDSPSLRETLSICSRLWKRLSEEIKIEIRSIRNQFNDDNIREQPKTQSTKTISPQYGLKRNVTKTVKWDDGVDRLAAVTQSYKLHDEKFLDDKYDSDDDVRMSAMVNRIGEDVEVQINKEKSEVIPTKPEGQSIVRQDVHIQGRNDPRTKVGKMLMNLAYFTKLELKNAIGLRELRDKDIVDSARVWNPGE